jgi:hypothetical protein
MNKFSIFYFFAIGLLFSCSNSISYFGRSYSPTETVDIYFREGDVKEQNEVMGKITVEVSAKKSSDKVQNQMMKQAKAKGADAIVFDEISTTMIGTTSKNAGGGVSGKRGFLGLSGSKTKYDKGQEIKCTVLKYSKNLATN